MIVNIYVPPLPPVHTLVKIVLRRHKPSEDNMKFVSTTTTVELAIDTNFHMVFSIPIGR